MVRAADKEDDLFALAAKGGSSAAKEGLPVGAVLFGSGPEGITQPGDPNDSAFTTRVKTPGKDDKPKPKPRGNAAERSVAEIQEAIQEKFDQALAVLSIAMPVTGTYGVENSEKTVNALISIAKRRPKLLAALSKAADGADGLTIGNYLFGLAVAVQVDLQRLPYDSMPAKVSGVTAIVEKYFLDDSDAPNPNVTEQVTHARFQPV